MENFFVKECSLQGVNMLVPPSSVSYPADMLLQWPTRLRLDYPDYVLQGVDIFSKNFLFIPIHEALHWSLVIVCYPGRVVNGKLKKPSVIHLDSMAGGSAGCSMLHCLVDSMAHVQQWPLKRGD